ncbi:MAG: Gfo/Idh/MocA family oxidoreductase [Bryobacterales bacterium]|nr:Gfo/Idh/MocA family oxidoreductase [Bryobacterales bacterium]
MNRRNFLTSSTALASTAALPRLAVAQSGKTYTTALIGAGWWGGNILGEAMAAKRSRIVGICDVDNQALDATQSKVKQLTSDEPRRYKDFRELLAKEKPEIVIVATPDHWHALAAIAAMEAGAHVYVEKPISHTIREGRAMVNAARASNRVVQVGTHRRVSPHNIAAIEFLKAGKAGRIHMVRCFVHSGGRGGEPTPNSEVPAGLDWEMWCGPAPLHPYNKALHPKGFRMHLDYANGVIADWGIHWFDQVLWWSEEKTPKSAYSAGGRFVDRTMMNAPDAQTATYQFTDFILEWEHRRFAGNNSEKHPLGAYFYGTEGVMHIGWQDGFTFYPVNAKAQTVHMDAQLNLPDRQNIRELWADFLTAIETKRRPVCDIEYGHQATVISLLGNLSMKLGRSVKWDGVKEEIPGDAAANKLLARDYRGEWKYPV